MESPVSSNVSSDGWTVDGNFVVAYSEDGKRESVINNVRWKFVAVIAIIAMAVSLLSGGLGGIRFGVLITRVLIGGVVFGVFAVVLNLLIARVFPEILDDGDSMEANEAVTNDSETLGSRVDIVLPSETPEVLDSSEFVTDSGVDNEEAAEMDHVDEDKMDNLDKFSGSFSDTEDEKIGSGRPTFKGPDGEHDAEELAQAIHTVITRDEKG